MIIFATMIATALLVYLGAALLLNLTLDAIQ